MVRGRKGRRLLKARTLQVPPPSVVRIRGPPGAHGTTVRSDRAPPVGRAALGTHPSPRSPRAPRPAARAHGLSKSPQHASGGLAFPWSLLSSAQTETGLLPPLKAPRPGLGGVGDRPRAWPQGLGVGRGRRAARNLRTFARRRARLPPPAPGSLEALPPLPVPGPSRQLGFLKVYSERLARRPGWNAVNCSRSFSPGKRPRAPRAENRYFP